MDEERLEREIAAYKPRPENAEPSRKKDQRNAELVRQVIKERKRVKTFQEKQQQEEARKQRRVDLFARLKANSLDKDVRDHLASSSILAKPIANAQRETGKVGERQRRKDRKRNGGAAAASIVVVAPPEEDDESFSEQEEEEEEKQAPSAAPALEESSSEEEEEEEEPAAVAMETSAPAAVEVPMAVPKPAFVVSPARTAEVELSRSALTICSMEQEIMEHVNEHDVVFICGDTGSGKTTQVPQMLLEAGFGCLNHPSSPGLIAVTQPRRFAAISVAERVGVELNAPVIASRNANGKLGNRYGTEAADLRGCVGYQIRHDQTTCHEQSTRIKFMTDGILLAELKEDFLLTKYSTIVMDEVHERGLNSDLLLGLLSRIVPLRRKMYQEETEARKIFPLKLVIMSATMDIEDFAALGFARDAPVVQVTGNRPFTVTPHFSKRTEQIDYLNATFRKCCQVHEKLPARPEEGGDGILVFLTGQREIEWFCRKLREKYNDQVDEEASAEAGADAEEVLELAPLAEEDEDDDDNGNRAEPRKTKLVHKKKQRRQQKQEESESSEEESELSGLEEGEEESSTVSEVHVVPLYSRLSADKQKRVFAQDLKGRRLIVVSTNVAETSLTIPGIRYVVDSGREKRRVYDQRAGTSSFRVEFISQSSAKQRMGRAGRTSNGHCYRLYSTAVFENLMDAKTSPETNNVPIDDLVLYMKNLGMDNIVDFPFPSPLDPVAIHGSLVRLQQLGVLDAQNQTVTKLGAQVAKLPVNVRIAKTLTLCQNEPKCASVLPHCVTLCALLSLPSPFEVSPKTNFCGDGSSDALSLLRAAGAYSYVEGGDAARAKFCEQFGLNFKTMKESEALTAQLARKVLPSASNSNGKLKLSVLNANQEALLKQAIIAGLIDHVARKSPESKFHKLKPSETPYVSCDENLGARELYIHPHSVLLSDVDNDLFELPDFICYSSVSAEGRMEGCTKIDSSWLRALSFGTAQCQDRLLSTPEPVYDAKLDAIVGFVKPEFGPSAWPLPIERQELVDEGKIVFQTFARALLEGSVVGALVKPGSANANVSAWIDPPAHCTRAPFQSRVVKLVNRLMQAKVSSRKALLAKLSEGEQQGQQEPFLLAEITSWIKPSGMGDARGEFEAKWKQLAASAKLNKGSNGALIVNWT